MSTAIAEMAMRMRRSGALGPEVRRAIDAELRQRAIAADLAYCERLKLWILDLARRRPL